MGWLIQSLIVSLFLFPIFLLGGGLYCFRLNRRFDKNIQPGPVRLSGFHTPALRTESWAGVIPSSVLENGQPIAIVHDLEKTLVTVRRTRKRRRAA